MIVTKVYLSLIIFLLKKNIFCACSVSDLQNKYFVMRTSKYTNLVEDRLHETFTVGVDSFVIFCQAVMS